MFKKIFLFLVMGMFILGMSKIAFSMMCPEGEEQCGHMKIAQAENAEHAHEINANAGPSSEKAVDAGNEICPVSGEKIDEKQKGTYEYKGKIYNFCCPMCIGPFKKDPEKYIKSLEKEKADKKESSEHHHSN